MRIALQISGELRTVSTTLPALEQYFLSLPSVETDVFLHTWRYDSEEDPHRMTHGQGIYRLQPRSYRLEAYEDRYDLHELPRSYSMFYSIGKANEIRKTYERLTEASYDLVIRYRTDCLLRETPWPSLHRLIANESSFLWIPQPSNVSTADGPVDENEEEAICDWFAIGTPDAMDVYCGTYDTWKDIGLPVLPESMLALQLKSRGITRKTILRRDPLDLVLLDKEGKPR